MHSAAQALLVPGCQTVRCIPMSEVSLQPIPIATQIHAQPEAAADRIPDVVSRAARTVAVVYVGGIFIHHLEDAVPGDEGRGRTMQAIRHSLGLHEPVFLRPQMLLHSLPSLQMVAIELDEVDRTALVDLRNIGGCLSFATVLPSADSTTCLYEAAVPPRDWHMQQAFPALLRLGALFAQDSADLPQSLPSRQGVRVVTVSWRGYDGNTQPPETTGRPVSSLSSDNISSGARHRPGLWPVLALLYCRSWPPIAALVLFMSALPATVGHPEGSGTSSLFEPNPKGFLGTHDLLPTATHLQYADLLRVQPAEELPSSQIVIGGSHGVGHLICAQVWSPDRTQQFTLPVEDLQTQLKLQLKMTDSSSSRRPPVLVTPPLSWPCLQFVAPHKDPDFVTILVDLKHQVICLDVTRHRLAADLFQQLRDRLGLTELRTNRGMVASVRHGELIRVFGSQTSTHTEIGSISFSPFSPASGQWLGDLDCIYVAGPFIGLIRVAPAPREPLLQLPQLLFHHTGTDGTLIRLPSLPGGHSIPFPVYCLVPHDVPCHVVLVLDAHNQWLRPVIQVVQHCSSFVDALQVLSETAAPQQAFWQQLSETLPVFFPFDVRAGVVSASLVTLDVLRASQFGWHLSQAGEAESLWITPSTPSLPFRDSSTQTSPSFWPATAIAVETSVLPQVPRVQSCIPFLQLCPDGPPTQLLCPQFQVSCTMPCLPGYFPWGLRVGTRVFGVCTSTVNWQHVLTIAEADAWDLSGMEVLGENTMWTWPADLSDLAGQCGHLLHSGTDPLLCTGGQHVELPHASPGTAADSTTPGASRSSTRPRGLSITLWLAASVGHIGQAGQSRVSFLVATAFMFASSAATRSLPSSDNASDIPDLSPRFDDTRTRTVAWCHELSCQANEFTVTPEALHQYVSQVSQVSPDPLIRCHLWRPFQGPAVFEFGRDVQLPAFEALLTAAGHTEDDSLIVAYDTLGTTLEVLSVPRDSTRWWIVRDGLGRELLRPVTTWTEPGACYVLTVNSHGQAQALSCTPDVSRRHNIPQGVRAAITLPFTRMIGQMTSRGFELAEVAIGTLAYAKRPIITSTFVLFSLIGIHLQALGMQASPPPPQQVQVVSRWNEPQRDPAVTRIWTYTCDEPVEVPYVASPDPALMYHQVGSNGRGIPAAGDFVWTLPRVVQGCAHILHFPPRSHPPYVFWLLHFRARGHVVASAEHVFDWSYIGAVAAEAFGETWFAQGSFGIVHQGRVLGYGDNIGIPPHGTILHLTRTSLQPRTSQSIWDTPADPNCVVPFDYDICRGQRGKGPVYPVMPTTPTSTHAAGQAQASCQAERPAEPSLGRQLNRQITDIGNDLQVLITRLETAGVLPTPEVAPWVTQAPDEADPPAQSDSFASRLTNRISPLMQCSLWWLASGLQFANMRSGGFLTACVAWQVTTVQGQDHDHDDSSEVAGPSEPSSPADAADVSAPTPLTALLHVEGGTPVVRSSPDPLASTSIPGQAEAAPASQVPLTCDIATAQHRFACAIRGIQQPSLSAAPFVPAGIPVITHNPFTGRPQCRLWTTEQRSPRVLLNTLSDYANRRGWQNICEIHPQPDHLAVHLMPSAANADLAAVVLQAEGALHPRCVQRTLPLGGTGAVTINGRAGRVQAPYSTRPGHGPVSLRDGDCLPVNFGPYGPPPPQPVHSAAHMPRSLSLFCLGLAFSGNWRSFLGASLLFVAAMDHNPRLEDTKPIYRISAFPWRLPLHERTAEGVCDRHRCRYTVLCPWTGPQGTYSAAPSTPVLEVWQHYRSILPGWPDQQFAPTWPGLRHDRITVIPVPPSPALACVVVRQSYHARAVLLHAQLTHDHLCRIIQHHTPWRPAEVFLPPAAQVASQNSEGAVVRLRTGDVIDILETPMQRHPIGVNNPDTLRGYAHWNLGVGLMCTTLIRLWDTTWVRPIITWLSPGAEWVPSQLSFSGDFQASYPGKWVPIAWSPSRILQFMRVSESAEQANVLVEQADRTFAATVDAVSSGATLAHALQVPSESVTIIGAHIADPAHPCYLRNGDIIRTVLSHAPTVPIYGWPDDDTGELGPTLDIGAALLLPPGMDRPTSLSPNWLVMRGRAPRLESTHDFATCIVTMGC